MRPPDSRLGHGWTEPAPELSASGVGGMGSCGLPPCGHRDRHHMACCCRGQRNGAGPGPLPALRRAKWLAAARTELGWEGPVWQGLQDRSHRGALAWTFASVPIIAACLWD